MITEANGREVPACAGTEAYSVPPLSRGVAGPGDDDRTGGDDGGDGGDTDALSVPLDGELLDALFVASPPADRSGLLGSAATEAHREWSDRRPRDLARVRASDYRFTGVVADPEGGLRPALSEFDVAAVEAAEEVDGDGGDRSASDGDPLAEAFDPEGVTERERRRRVAAPSPASERAESSDRSTIGLAREAQADVVAGVRDELFFRVRNHVLFDPLGAVVDELCLGRLHAARVESLLDGSGGEGLGGSGRETLRVSGAERLDGGGGEAVGGRSGEWQREGEYRSLDARPADDRSGDDGGADGEDRGGGVSGNRLAAFRLAGVSPADTDAEELREHVARTRVPDGRIARLLAIDGEELREVKRRVVSGRLDRLEPTDPRGGAHGPATGPGVGRASGPCGRCGDPARLHVRDVADGGYLPMCRDCALGTVRRYASVLGVGLAAADDGVPTLRPD